MKIVNRRIALLTGASVAVLGYAVPAFAATTVKPGVCDASGTLDITLVGDTGVTSANNPALAVVDGCTTGEIIQGAPAGGDVALLMTNGAAGDVDVGAIASATNDAGNATATASIVGAGFTQIAEGTGEVAIQLQNAGRMAVEAIANATATGVAQASANYTGAFGFPYGYGIFQSANGLALGGATAVAASISNAAGASISVAASANANGATATADAHADWGIWQTANGGGKINIDLTNAGVINIDSNANAVAVNGAASGDADLIGGIVQIGYTGTTVDVSLNNTGDIGVAVSALANGVTAAHADAALTYGIAQSVNASVGSVVTGTASIVNDGNITIGANAVAVAASGPANAHAQVGTTTSGGAGLIQVVSADTASAAVSNTGTITVAATAMANATGAADAGAEARGIEQMVYGHGGDAAALVTNGGTLSGTAAAVATGSLADAHAKVSGVQQIVSATGSVGTGAAATPANASATLTNSGTIALTALGNAHGGAAATAVASVYTGVFQSAHAAGSAALSIVNSGTFSAHANATALADTGKASASAHVYGLSQSASGGTASLATVDNEGTIDIGLVAKATGGTSAVAHAFGNAVYQVVGSGTASFTNGGSLSIHASDSAIATGHGFAAATALGVAQTATGGHDVFVNNGTTDVGAKAFVSASSGSAFAYARAYAAKGGAADLDVTNAGSISVAASATAPDTVRALAVGMYLSAGATTAAATPTQVAVLSGTVVNSGDIKVFAHASGGGVQTVATASGGVTTVNRSQATATGIAVNSGINDLTITNSGTISVDAITSNGAPSLAYGIHVLGTGGGVAPAADDVLTINNSGDIIARFSTDGGTTFHRATAIDVTEAPNPTVINLLGGNITGDINVQDGDAINVTDGETVFNGVINAGCFDADAIAARGNNPGLSSCGVGSLTIGDGDAAGGNLHMAIDPVDGPSYAFVNSFTVNSDGTLTLDLPAATGGTAEPGTYPQVFADTANLDGTLVANIASPNGLFDTMTYDNVIDANVRKGEFAQCMINGIPTGSLLLHLGCVYDAANNVDLALTRTAFDGVAGLNGNGAAVGTGLDSFFDVNATAGQALLFNNLFLITDQANYNIALNQLAGSSYANYLNSFPSLGVHYDDLVDHATNCEIPALAGSVLECRASSPIHIWGQLDYQTRKADGDVEAGDSRSKRFTGLVGVDAAVGNAAIVGVEGGYVTNHFRDDQFSDSIKGDGWQVGGYAVYDPGAFYLKGLTTYSSLNGDSTRHIAFGGLGTGLTFAATPNGSPDVKMWTFGLHGGARLSMSANSVITPYLNYDYVNAKLRGFDEDNGNGADLTISSGKSNHSFLTGGVKWGTQMGGVVPEVNLGYRYRFGDTRSSFHGWFTPDPENDFDIVSAAQKKGTFLAGLSVGGKVGPVDLRIGYEGEFNGDVTSHSGNFKIVVPIGGHAAPPPPPPPPPAPVVEQPAPPPPPPPPPPPAPVERGERG